MNTGGITDMQNNPFALPSWIEQGYALTSHRKDQLQLLVGKGIEEIKSMNRNKGKYVAFVAIRWGFAAIVDNTLVQTEKWNHRGNYNETGQLA